MKISVHSNKLCIIAALTPKQHIVNVYLYMRECVVLYVCCMNDIIANC